VRGAVTGEYGAQVALLIHQEKLDVPKGMVMTPNARAVWGALAEVARQLAMARAERFRKLLPPGVEVAALIAAMCSSKLTVAVMVPAGTKKPRWRCARQ
jgi:hypothetical protein